MWCGLAFILGGCFSLVAPAHLSNDRNDRVTNEHRQMVRDTLNRTRHGGDGQGGLGDGRYDGRDDGGR